MGQVPPHPSITILGDGKVARHFSYFFQQKQISFNTWSRRSQRPLEEAIRHSRTVLLLIKDSAIEELIRAHPELSQKTRVHFSGCLTTPLAIGMHPLMTFGPELYPDDVYEKIPFICEIGPERFEDLFPTLSNPVYTIASEHKAFYHALCVMSGNFSVILWQKLFQELQTKFGIPREAALPYLKQVTENLVHHPARALTGPLQRKDASTLEKNLSSLGQDPFQKIYQAFVEVHQ
jgi:2-dehydropantoate 2-reductase